jgi:hypothetical protein
MNEDDKIEGLPRLALWVLIISFCLKFWHIVYTLIKENL